MRRLATGLLLGSSVAFVCCLIYQDRHPLLAVLRGAFEGAMISGIADWFAVTALFRHPMGLPIPHTALIPKRKDEIGRQLGSFIRINFLQPKIILSKWRDIGFLRHLQKWLTAQGSVQKIASPTLAYCANWIEHNIAQTTSPKITVTQLEEFWHQRAMGDKLHGLSQKILTEDRRDAIIERGITFIDELLDTKGAAIGKAIAGELEKSGRVIVANKLLDNWPDLQRKIQAKLYRARYEPDFPLRKEMDQFFERIVNDRELLKTVESSFFSLLSEPAVEKMINDGLQEQLTQGASSLAKQMRDNADSIAASLENALSGTWQRFFDDPKLCRNIERGTEALLLRMVRRHGYFIETFIAAEVSKWDGQQTSNLIENQVGKDLQWIRINGSIIGFICGGTIQAVALITLH